MSLPDDSQFRDHFVLIAISYTMFLTTFTFGKWITNPDKMGTQNTQCSGIHSNQLLGDAISRKPDTS